MKKIISNAKRIVVSIALAITTLTAPAITALAAPAVPVLAATDTSQYRAVAPDGTEYPTFFNATLNVTQPPFSNISHKDKNVTDIVVSGGRIRAFVTMTVKYIDKSWGYVVCESDNPVLLPDGSLTKICFGFMHDNNINDLYIGRKIRQGEGFYDQGTKTGKGGQKVTGSHIHVICMRGAFTNSMKSKYSSRGNIYLYDAIYLSSKTTVKSGSKWSESKFKRVPQTTVTPVQQTISVSNVTMPVEILQGSYFGIYLDASVNYGTISSMYCEVPGYFKHTVSPNCASASVRKSYGGKKSLNDAARFDLLPAGNYTMTVSISGSNNATWSQNYSFVVKSKNQQVLSTKNVNAPTRIQYKKCFGLRGEFYVNNNGTITYITGRIVNAYGNIVYEATDWPNAKSFNIRYGNVNSQLYFDKLARGNYTYQLVVKTSANAEKTIVNQGFSIY